MKSDCCGNLLPQICTLYSAVQILFLQSVSQSFRLESPTAAYCCNPRFAIAINIRFLARVLSLRVLRYQPEITPLRASPVATIQWIVCQILDAVSATAVGKWVCPCKFAPDNGSFKQVAQKKRMLLVDLSQQLGTHWLLVDLPQWLDTCWLLVGLPQQLAGHKVQICDTCSIGIKYCIRLKIWLLVFTLFKSLHLQNRCTNLTIIILKSLIYNTDCMPLFFYEIGTVCNIALTSTIIW